MQWLLKCVQFVSWRMLQAIFTTSHYPPCLLPKLLKSADFWPSYSKNKMWTQWRFQKGDEWMYPHRRAAIFFTGYSTPTDTLAGFKGSICGRERTRKERMDNPLCHQFLDPPLLTHARANTYILAAMLLSLEVKLKPPLIVWRYRLQWFVLPFQQSKDKPHWLQGWRSRGGYSHSLFAFFLQFINQNTWIYRSILVRSDVIEMRHRQQAGR